jgi:RNA polymerase primary sigma factor
VRLAPGQPNPWAARCRVIVAPPGADQERSAVRCLAELHRQGETANIIARGKVLQRYLRSLLPFEKRRDGVVLYHPYVDRLWTTVLGTPHIRLDEYNLDLWEFRRQLIYAPGHRAEEQYLVVVHGQQLPAEFYSLLRLLNISTTVFVDSAIDVSEDGSTLSELCRIVGVSSPVVLQNDARTTAPIHDFVDYFHTGQPEFACRRPNRDGPRPMLLHHETTDGEVHFILEYARAHPQAHVGVLVPYGDMVTMFRDALVPCLENRVQWHLAGEHIVREEQVDFQAPGVKVLTWTSALGLEFDTVVLAGLHYAGFGQSSLRFQTTLQTLATAARSELVLSYSGRGEPTILDCLPKHLLDDRTVLSIVAESPPPLIPVRPSKESVLVREYSSSGRPDRAVGNSPVDVARVLLAVDRHNPENRRRVLTADEEVGLTQLMRGERVELTTELPRGFRAALDPNDERAAAFDAMVTHNDGLVWSNVKKLRGTNMDEEDLYQHGVLGLMRAIEKFNAAMGTKFSTYASYWIRQALQRAVDDEGAVIRIPVHLHEVIRKILSTRDRLLARDGRASVAAISHACKTEPGKVIECLRLSAGFISLDAPLGDDSGFSFIELLPAAPSELTPDHILDRKSGAQLVQQALSGLKDRQGRILRLRFGFDGGDGLTLDEIGEKLGLTRERIRQIETKAKQQLVTELAKVGLVDSQIVDAEWPALRPKHLRIRHPADEGVCVRRSRLDLASGSRLLRTLGSPRPPLGLRDLLLQLVDQGLDSGAHRIVIQSSQTDAALWLAMVHDGEPTVEAVLRNTLLTTSTDDDRQVTEAWRPIETALRLFDEMLVWTFPAQTHPSNCLVLTNAPRTDTWWLSQATGQPPPAVMNAVSPGPCCVVVLRAPRQRHPARSFHASLTAMRFELGLVLGDLLHASRVALTISDQKVALRDPFLWRNPGSQDLGTELVSADGHSALVNPRVLPHPAALRDDDRYSAGEPEGWAATQGFYVRCAGRYLSCTGWLGLEGLDSTPDTALARVAVEIAPAERQAWGFDRTRGVIAPPKSLRPRLTALAMLARRRSELVIARKPVTLRPRKGST